MTVSPRGRVTVTMIEERNNPCPIRLVDRGEDQFDRDQCDERKPDHQPVGREALAQQLEPAGNSRRGMDTAVLAVASVMRGLLSAVRVQHGAGSLNRGETGT
jgi:hypothetical protein